MDSEDLGSTLETDAIVERSYEETSKDEEMMSEAESSSGEESGSDDESSSDDDDEDSREEAGEEGSEGEGKCVLVSQSSFWVCTLCAVKGPLHGCFDDTEERCFD